MTVGGAQRGALGVLLFAGVLTPVAATAMGWPPSEPAMAAMAATVCVLLGTVLLRIADRPGRWHAMAALLTLLAAMAFAAILHDQSNAFYTSGALVGGMIILLTLHVGARVLRYVVLRDQSRAQVGEASPLLAEASVIPALELEHLPPNEIRVVRRASEVAPTMVSREEDVPAFALADRLADIAAWLLALFWLLVATGHRHVATGALLLTGILVSVRCLAFLPEIIASRAQSRTDG
jgi:hypothetical protein